MHCGYRLAGGKIEVKKELLSNYQLRIIEHDNSSLSKNKELISNLSNKKIETPLLKCQTLFKCMVAIQKNSQKIRIQIRSIFKSMYWTQYGFAKRSQERR